MSYSMIHWPDQSRYLKITDDIHDTELSYLKEIHVDTGWRPLYVFPSAAKAHRERKAEEVILGFHLCGQLQVFGQVDGDHVLS